MDKIVLEQMAFYGYHGLFAEEKKLGQRYYVDLTLELDLSEAGETDQMDASIDYGAVYHVIKDIVEGPSKQLIEAVASKIAKELFQNFPSLQACRVKVYKPDPPIPGHYRSVAVEIYRERSSI
ncbi:dihydroneopterin aldolase [Gracilibacillus sp. YIM 98692]|uniref:dihydroneopterin aldolase n=1 Tax=Gracilibacillus sp. YIM 98692 TaxID=2663532 RepID=UPI0013D2F4F0|nr:dihydroneopterin aldolase [Gracilibacillus sp. YIM 98692]